MNLWELGFHLESSSLFMVVDYQPVGELQLALQLFLDPSSIPSPVV